MTTPILQTATVNGSTLTLSYDIALDGGAPPVVGDFSVQAGGGPVTVNSVAIDGANVILTLNTPVTEGQTVTVSYTDPTVGDDPAAIQDALGDDAASLSNAPVTNQTDNTSPTVVVSVDDAALASGETAQVTFSFSEAPTGFTADDVTTVNGAISAFAATGDPLVYTATFTPAAEGAASVGVTAASYADAAGNTGAGHTANLAYDTTAPTLVITVDDANITTAETAVVTFTFSEAPAGFVAGDVTATNGALSGFAATGDPLVYTATFTPAGTGAAAVSVAAAAYADTAGNDGGQGDVALNVSSPPPPPPAEPTPTGGNDSLSAPDSGGDIAAGDGDDGVNGGAGGDTLQGNAGADSVSGGSGDDIARGGQGDDVVQGNAGADFVFGDKGADIVRGGQGDDLVQGNADNDFVFGDLGEDIVHGGQGADLVHGNGGNDIVSGDRGADTVHGGAGDDIVHGGEGADYVSGDKGNDILSGGDGADTFVFAAGGAQHDIILDFSKAEGDMLRLAPELADNYDTISQAMSETTGGDVIIAIGSHTITVVGTVITHLTADVFGF